MSESDDEAPAVDVLLLGGVGSGKTLLVRHLAGMPHRRLAGLHLSSHVCPHAHGVPCLCLYVCVCARVVFCLSARAAGEKLTDLATTTTVRALQ